MKLKQVLALLILIVPSVIFSQRDSISKIHCRNTKFPTEKTVMLELNFNPFSTTGVISFENFQTKYWLNDKTVLRLGLQLKNKVTSLTNDDYDVAESHKMNASEKTFLYGFKPGIEFRFLQHSKISPYVGFEFQYKNQSSNADYKEYNQSYSYVNNAYVYTYEFVETKIDGGLRNITTGSYVTSSGTYSYSSTNYNTERSFSSLGGNLLVGSDFYFVKNMYFGFEVGLGYESVKYKQVIIDISTNVKKTTLPSYTISNLGFYYNSAIRLGVWF